MSRLVSRDIEIGCNLVKIQRMPRVTRVKSEIL